jgi:hypothetical protein
MFKVDHGHGFCDVQLAGIAFSVDTMEVVEAIGEVGILLDFAENHSGADGVRRPGRNVKGITRRDRQALQKMFQPALFYCRLKLFPIYFGDQAEQ